ncbi:MAG: recombinase family protein [Clostridia bacterium]|nr:recombinase family protein [Clostridia bacterium]
MSKIYGFARCSLSEEKGQDLNRQVRELQAAGAEEIITERVHGDAKVKPQLDFLLEHIENGSTLIVCEVSRLSRSVLQFCEIMELVKEKHLRLEVLGSITVDCRSGEIDPMSAAFLQMASIFAELEKNILRSRVRSGMANAKAKGKQIGRRPTTKDDLPAVFIKYYPAYADGSMTVTELARICQISRPTAYKYIKMVG